MGSGHVSAADGRGGTAESAEIHLTQRESEIARAVGRGLSNKQIAAECSLALNTVKFHLSSIYRKLAVGSRLQLFLWSIENGGYAAEVRGADPVAPEAQEVE